LFIFIQVKHSGLNLDKKNFQCFSTAVDDFRENLLRPLLIERVSGTIGNTQARQHILSKLHSTNLWDVELDTFDSMTPVSRNIKSIDWLYALLFVCRTDKSSLRTLSPHLIRRQRDDLFSRVIMIRKNCRISSEQLIVQCHARCYLILRLIFKRNYEN